MTRNTLGFHLALGLAVGLFAGCTNKDAGVAGERAEKGETKIEAAAKADDDSGAAEAGVPGEADTPIAPGLPDAAELLKKAEEAAGGKQAFAAIHSFYKEGKVSLQGQNIEGGLRSWWKDGDFYVENNIAGVGKAEGGKQGEVIWMSDPINGVRQVDGAEAEQARWGSSLSMLGDWQVYFERAQTTGERELDGKKVYDVELTAKSGAKVVVTLDAGSGLQVAQSYEQASPMGATPVSVKFEDFREVAGVKMPFRNVMDAKLAIIVETLTKVEVNVEVDTSKFALPTGGAEVVAVPMRDPAGAGG